ncbi:cytochrome c, testis-specific-like [Apis laboriosa]|uniref:cytochrome c, testis-specific-like n=1 Tax=Apis laboriosa TaxID=183418 RepID=UPI001CC57EB2|nr:cytochrome c, testis-specific-like [Apis laboriosa]
MGDPVKGKTLFVRMCSMCHTVGKNEKHRVGPNLFGIFGKTCGTSAGFNYTDAMKNKNIVWNETTLDEYLRLPKDFVPGTRMVFNGIKKADERKDVIAYLATLK